jgi:hypothetical protein
VFGKLAAEPIAFESKDGLSIFFKPLFQVLSEQVSSI